MRILLAGASGVLGQRLIPRLVAVGHTVAGLTRSPAAVPLLTALGAEPVVCDVFDQEALALAVRGVGPDVILNELTDLPDDAAHLRDHDARNARIRAEGNQNLLDAARRAGSPALLAQSVAWPLQAGVAADAVAELERSILAHGGVVIRYGRFYGPGTWYENDLPPEPRVHVDRAADRTVGLLGAPAGVVVVTD